MNICGNPSITLVNYDGTNVDFLTATYSDGTVTVALPDVSTAVKATYTISAVFA